MESPKCDCGSVGMRSAVVLTIGGVRITGVPDATDTTVSSAICGSLVIVTRCSKVDNATMLLMYGGLV